MKKLNFFLALPVILMTFSCKNNTMIKSDDLNNKLSVYVENIIKSDFTSIGQERKAQLDEFAQIITERKSSGDSIKIVFICTHNSRRSHMSQLWAQTAAYYYRIRNVHCYSGGTESTAFNYRTVRAISKAGFEIEQTDTTSNPVYHVKFREDMEPIKAFSKKYSHHMNPNKGFIAAMTCSHADETCPIVYGSDSRVSIPYEDPKVADDTPEEELRYDERCKQIATEMFYVFSQI